MGTALRQVAAFIIGVVVVVLALWAWRVLPERLGNMQRDAANLQHVAEALAVEQRSFADDAADAVAHANQDAARLRFAGNAELNRAEAAARHSRTVAASKVLTPAALYAKALQRDPAAIVASYRAQYVELPLADGALAVIGARRSNLKSISKLNARIKKYNREATKQRVRIADRDWLRAEARAQRRDPLCRQLAVPRLCAKVIAEAKLDRNIKAAKPVLDSQRRVIEAQRRGLRLFRTGLDDGARLVAEARAKFGEEARRRRVDAGSHVLNAVGREFERSWLLALAVITAVFLATPIGRVISFLSIAPLATRARPLRLRHSGASSQLALGPAATLDLTVDVGSDVYLREGARGATGGTAARTVLLPLGRKMMVGASAGISGIQLLQPSASGTIAVAPAADAAIDVAAVVVPAGGAVTFHPAAFVGAIVARGARLPIERISRWFDARSWATFHFRHYIFTGPGTLLLQGLRGVGARPAGAGWADDSRLTIAFDAHLARGSRRRGSLWRFVAGRQALFDDFFDGHGCVYAEHRPSRPIAANPASRLLGRIGDAILKAVGFP